MKWEKYLANLGYGTRRDVGQMIRAGRVMHADGRPFKATDDASHDTLRVDHEPLDPPPGSAIAFHKPVGYVCSTHEASQLIYELLPSRFRVRSPVMAPVGRLDKDSSGLLVLTDDGQLNHRMTSPRSHLPKVYEATLAEALTGMEAELFASGTLLLDGETTPLKPATLELRAQHVARVTITEGRYHQVRRMFSAVGNHVTALHRVAIGPIELGDLPMGQWRLLGAGEVAAIRRQPSADQEPISGPSSPPAP